MTSPPESPFSFSDSPPNAPGSNSAKGSFPTESIENSLPSSQPASIASRIEALLAVDGRGLSAGMNTWPFILSGRTRYVLEMWIDKKKKRTSWIRDWGVFTVGLSPAGDRLNGRSWICSLCPDITLFCSTATSSAASHLNSVHQKYYPAKHQEPPAKKRKLVSVLDMQRFGASTRSPSVVPIPVCLADAFKDAVIDWVIEDSIPFHMIEGPAFRHMLALVSPGLTETLLPKSANTIKAWVEERFATQADQLRERIMASKHKKNLSFDAWTSPNGDALFGIFLHFVDACGKLVNCTLGVPRIWGKHGGDNLAPIITRVLAEYGIGNEEVGYFQADNTDNNDTSIRHLIRELEPGLDADGWADSEARRRVRCFGHILNLTAKAFIEGDSRELLRTLEPHDNLQNNLEEEDKILKEWRKRGPVGKLHNLVHHVRCNPQRRDSFLNVANRRLSAEELEAVGDQVFFDDDLIGLQLKADNSTRWNSVYSMIERAIRLRDVLDYWTFQSLQNPNPSKRVPVADVLSPEDWHILKEVKTQLEPFKVITKRFEYRKPLFCEVIPTMYYLVEELSNRRLAYAPARPGPAPAPPSAPGQEEIVVAEPPATPRRTQRATRPITHLRDYEASLPRRSRASSMMPPEVAIAVNVRLPHPEPAAAPDLPLAGESEVFLAQSLDRSIAKLKKYIKRLEVTPVYWVSMILHPGHKDKWIVRYLPGEQVLDIMALVTAFFDWHYPHIEVPEVPVEVQDFVNTYLTGHDYYDPPAYLSELQQYLQEPVKPVDDILAWWTDNKDRFPRLSRMAFDLLSIPAMSSDCERLSSVAKLIVGLRGHGLSSDTINKLLCLLNWRRYGLF